MRYELDIEVMETDKILIKELSDNDSERQNTLLELEKKIKDIEQIDSKRSGFDQTPTPMIEGKTEPKVIWWEIYTKKGKDPIQTTEEIKRIL